MYDAQARVATYLYEHDSVQAVVPMGGGKTCASMTAIRELIDDGHIQAALVIAPKKVAKLVWTKEHKGWEHLQDLRIQLVTGSPAERMKKLLAPGFDIYVVGIDNVKWLLEVMKKLPPFHPLWHLLCVDEMSKFKNPRGVRSKLMRKYAAKWKIKWGLTGTPRPNGYEDQFAPLSILTGNKLWGKRFDPWRDQYFMATDYHGRTWTIRPEHRNRIRADISKFSITVRDEDMPELPPLQPLFHWVELPPSAQRHYETMKKELIALLEKKNILAANAAVASGKMAQIAQGFMYDEEKGVQHMHSEKADLLSDLVECIDTPVIIVYEFREDLARLRELYGQDLPYLGAGVSDTKAELVEAEWNEGKYPRLAIHPKSAGHGLNLQFGGTDMIFYGMPWSAEDYDQTIKRFWRPGVKSRCRSHHIFARGTVDEIKFDRVTNKISEQEAFRNYIQKI